MTYGAAVYFFVFAAGFATYMVGPGARTRDDFKAWLAWTILLWALMMLMGWVESLPPNI